MADARWVSRRVSLLVTAAIIAFSMSGCHCVSDLYTVGLGSNMLWTRPPNSNNGGAASTSYFQAWAQSIDFVVNDTLYFSYDKAVHNVVFVQSSDELKSCTIENPVLFMDTTGSVLITIDSEGPFYVMSLLFGDQSDCTSGMSFSFQAASGIVALDSNITAPATPVPAEEMFRPPGFIGGQFEGPWGSSSPLPPTPPEDSAFLITHQAVPPRTVITIPWMPESSPDWVEGVLPSVVDVGSYLVFFYQKGENYSVYHVDEAHYELCNSTDALETINFGASAGLPAPGTYFYIDGNYSLCQESNMKINVTAQYYTISTKPKSTTHSTVIGLSIVTVIMALLIVCWSVYHYRKLRIQRLYKKGQLVAGGSDSGSAADKARAVHNKYLLDNMLAGNPGTGACMILFTFKELQAATKNFSKENELGSGSFGTVYKGILAGGSVVAIKRTKNHGMPDVEQFVNEVTILSQLNHRNLVKLLGVSLEQDVPLLVYEFVPNGTLQHHLRMAHQGYSTKLDWPLRFSIALQTAEALKYLHCQATPPIFHRDVKAANILLDDNFGAKVADFGLSKLVDVDTTHVSTAVRGTPGYMDPDYYFNSQLTDKSDVYSYGVVLLELITSQRPIDLSLDASEQNLAVRSLRLIRSGRVKEIIDERLTNLFSSEEQNVIEAVAQIAAACLVRERTSRPSMSEVVEMLQRVKGSKLRAETFYNKVGTSETFDNQESLAWSNLSHIFGSLRVPDYDPEMMV